MLTIAKDHERRTGLVDQLKAHNVPATTGNIPTDYFFLADPLVVMGDDKTPEDLIASVRDGRLHKQIGEMQRVGAYGFILVGGEWHTETIGFANHAWTFQQFNMLRGSIQEEGIKVYDAINDVDRVRQLKAIYERLRSGERGSWHKPEIMMPPYEVDGVKLIDKDYMARIGLLMHLPDAGVKTALRLMEAYGLMSSLGITEEGLAVAKERWLALKGVGKVTAAQWEMFLKEQWRG